MRRLARNLFTLCSVASMLLLVATFVLWSLRRFDGTFIYTSPLEMKARAAQRFEWRMTRSGGRLWVSRVDATFMDPHVIRSQSRSLIGWGHLPDPPPFAMYTGSTQHSGSGWVARVRGISFPLPLLVLLTSILPTARGAIFLRDRRIARRAVRGQCVSCGYDLRGTPSRCPECGAPSRKLQATK